MTDDSGISEVVISTKTYDRVMSYDKKIGRNDREKTFEEIIIAFMDTLDSDLSP